MPNAAWLHRKKKVKAKAVKTRLVKKPPPAEIELTAWEAGQIRSVIVRALNHFDPVRYMNFLMVSHPGAFAALAAKVLPGSAVAAPEPREPLKVVFEFQEGKTPKTINVTPERRRLTPAAKTAKGAKS